MWYYWIWRSLKTWKGILIKNTFPVTQNYIICLYRNLKTNELVRIDKILEVKLENKANKVLFLERKGIKVMLPNVLKIKSKLIKMQSNNNKSKEMKALNEAGRISKENGNSNMSLDEINEEIKKIRDKMIKI